MAFLFWLEKKIVRLEEYLLFTALVGLTSLQITQVLFRYFLNRPLHWVDELSRFVFIWMIMIGAGLAMAKAAHFSIDFIREGMPKLARTLAHIVAQGSIMLFSLVVIIQGLRLMRTGARQITAALQVPISVAYAAIPFGCALILYHALMAVPARLKSEGIIDAATSE